MKIKALPDKGFKATIGPDEWIVPPGRSNVVAREVARAISDGAEVLPADPPPIVPIDLSVFAGATPAIVAFILNTLIINQTIRAEDLPPAARDLLDKAAQISKGVVT